MQAIMGMNSRSTMKRCNSYPRPLAQQLLPLRTRVKIPKLFHAEAPGTGYILEFSLGPHKACFSV